MRMRSVLAAALLTVTLTAAGAATASAAGFEPRHGGGDDDGANVCATHYGGITSEEGNLVWGGSFCRGDF